MPLLHQRCRFCFCLGLSCYLLLTWASVEMRIWVTSWSTTYRRLLCLRQFPGLVFFRSFLGLSCSIFGLL